ncbi:conserved Plasmodium protein, unknown function [Plasmodium relictum]|uniref:Uncharacterized protein n=1 Tax=Plasmodium relictum TaxID=85471 RepID=A0A1J1HF07_PLARL|nr:conserved Plasmodium protein, unknown function [Plasmodium relictum]CRH02642.1 conserved Plasmodium protein, unknown function [Plasmodium relictum]
MLENIPDIILYFIRDVEIYLCIFILLNLFTSRRINKLTKSNFLQDDKLLDKLSKNFYISEVKVYFNPFKYILKSLLYHICYFITILYLIYIFRFYVCYKKFIYDYILSFFSFLKIYPLILNEFDYYSNNYGINLSFILIFIFGNFSFFLFYKIICFLKRRKKYIKVKRANVLNYCLELAKANFKEYLKTRKKKKDTIFKFTLNKTNGYYFKNNDKNYERSSKNIKKEQNDNKRITKTGRRNIFSYIFKIFLINKHVFPDEKLLYDNSINNKENLVNKKRKLPFNILKSLFHYIRKKKDIEKINNNENNLENKRNTSYKGKVNNLNSNSINEKQKNLSENKNINTSKNIHGINEEKTTSKCDSSHLYNNTEMEKKEIEDSYFNDISLYEPKLSYCNFYLCNSQYQIKSLTDILILYLPIYFLFKNKMFVKTSFTLMLYILNFIIWNFIKLVSMIKPSLFVFYYIFNEHISQILSENLSDYEKKMMLHFFYGFFFCSLKYLKKNIDIEFKLIKIEDMNNFHKIINDCLNKASKLKSQEIIKNYERMKTFPLFFDLKNKKIYIDKSILKTNKEIEGLKQKQKLKNEQNCLQSLCEIANFCDEDTFRELLKKIKNIILNELPEKLADNLSQKISDEIYEKMLNKGSLPLNKDNKSCICSSLKKNILFEIIEGTKSNELKDTYNNDNDEMTQKVDKLNNEINK